MYSNKKYGHVISLGYNCEVSFQFFKKYHFVESSLFAWVNCHDCQHMIKALQNLSSLTSKGFVFDGFMYRDIATDILFHAKEDKGESDEEKRQELASRISYLREKFLKTASDGKKNLYIFKYPSCDKKEDVVRKEILALFNVLKSLVKNYFDLLIIFEKQAYSKINIDNPNIFIEYVNYFTPENAVTTKPYDKKGYGKIFSKYKPDFKLPHQKAFKFEDMDNLEKKSHRKKYDLIFSLGAACSCSSLLIQTQLRRFSSPFDWLWGSDFLGRVKLLTSNFDRFLEKEDLVFCNCNNGDKSNLCDIYKNKYTQLVLNHDFPADVPLDSSFQMIKDKYNRRISRLLEQLDQASSVMIVFLSVPLTKDHPTEQQIIQGWQEIHQKYPYKDIDLLYFINDSSKKKGEYNKFVLSDHITKIIANYTTQKKNDPPYAVNMPFLKKLMANYELNISFKEKWKNKLLRTSIKCIPYKPLRKKLRRKYHV